MRELSLEGVQFLQSEEAEALLATLAERLATGTDALALLGTLREQHGYDPDRAGWLLDQAQLRRKAVGKLPSPELLLLNEEALQQASGAEVAGWRAARFAGRARVLDLCAGIGGDTIALAQAGVEVLAYEQDPVRAALLSHNVQVLGLADAVTVRAADWTAASDADFGGAQAAFVDPARRVDGRRVLGLDEMQPPLTAIEELRRRVPNVLVKVAPGLDTDEVPEDVDLEFVSAGGELKEALLAFGDLRRASVATVLPGPHDLVREGAEPRARVATPGAYLYEPDPAVVRAGLVRTLGQQLDAWQLHGRIAYLSSDAKVETPFARSWRVLEQGKFGKKQLSRWVRKHGAGRVVVKRRGVPIEPSALIKRLPKTKGGPELTVFLSRTDGTPLMILAE